jgi:hypothetical protein
MLHTFTRNVICIGSHIFLLALIQVLNMFLWSVCPWFTNVVCQSNELLMLTRMKIGQSTKWVASHSTVCLLVIAHHNRCVYRVETAYTHRFLIYQHCVIRLINERTNERIETISFHGVIKQYALHSNSSVRLDYDRIVSSEISSLVLRFYWSCISTV